MADPQAATLTQLRNIQARTGKTVAELLAALAASGQVKHGQRRAWLMEQFGLGYGDANTLAFFVDKPVPDLSGAAAATLPAVQAGDPLDALYTGAKAHLRPLHEKVMQAVRRSGLASRRPRRPISACAARSSSRCWGRPRRTRSRSASMPRACRRIRA